jgi:predicted AAA+ superfamily ATPase
MKKNKEPDKNELRGGYKRADFPAGLVRGKYAKRMKESSNIIILRPEVAQVFPNEEAVNNALVNALSTRTLDESLADTFWWGRLVENAVGGYFCNRLNSVKFTHTYWRERDQEVDFVISRRKDVWAIEVKSGRRGKGSGLSRFRNRYPKARVLMVGGSGIPLEEFFCKDPPAFLT